MTFESVPGFSGDITSHFYPWLAKRLPERATFVEVGVLLGRSVAFLGELRPDLDLWAVDTWENGDREGEMAEYQKKYGPTTWMAFLRGMAEHSPAVFERLHVIRSRSVDVTVPLADAAFIDAAHDYEGCAADIAHYRKLLKPGGILCGHDYEGVHHSGVVQAVDEAFGGHHHIGPEGWQRGGYMSCWWWQA